MFLTTLSERADIIQTPKKYVYLDRIFNQTVVDDQGQPTREVRIVLGWHYDSKHTRSWLYSVTNKSRHVFEWIKEEDTVFLHHDHLWKDPVEAEKST